MVAVILPSPMTSARESLDARLRMAMVKAHTPWNTSGLLWQLGLGVHRSRMLQDFDPRSQAFLAPIT
jgi:hypothetical protein